MGCGGWVGVRGGARLQAGFLRQGSLRRLLWLEGWPCPPGTLAGSWARPPHPPTPPKPTQGWGLCPVENPEKLSWAVVRTQPISP